MGLAVLGSAADRPGKADNIAAAIPSQFGNKSALTRSIEKAIDRHPMISGALRGVVSHYPYCLLFSSESSTRPREELMSTQFNGGELKIAFTYFCFSHTKKEIETAERRLQSGGDEKEANLANRGWSIPPDMADVVVTITGDFSRATQEIKDPAIRASGCYDHFCGSN